MYFLVVIALLSAVEANQEFTCKPQPGCHFARCSPLWPVTVPALRERNEFPINCVKNGTDPKDEDQDNVLESHKKKISELTDELTKANEKIKKLEANSAETSQDMATQTQKLSELQTKLTDANTRITELSGTNELAGLRNDLSRLKKLVLLQLNMEIIAGRAYFFGETEQRWPNARFYCISLGGDLAAKGIREIRAFEEISKIANQKKRNYWIGLTDMNKEGRYQFVDGVVASTSDFFWEHAEPNGGGGSNCMVLWSAASRKVADVYCNKYVHPICEFEFI